MGVNYIVELHSSFRGVNQLNRFFYKDVVNSLAYTAQLSTIFESVLTDQIRRVTSNAVVYNLIKVSAHNVLSGAEIQRNTRATALFGLVTGEALSPFVAWGFQKIIVPAVGRKMGGNRFSGIGEGDLVNSDPVATAAARLNTLADYLKVLLVTANGQFIPSVAKYNPVTKVYTDYQEIITTAYRWVTSQNTRKFGRGS